MNTLHLNSFTWMLITVDDYQSLSKGITRLTDGYQHIASPQGTYYLPGSTTEWARIRDIIRHVDTDMPTVDQLKSLATMIDGDRGIYKFESNDDIWHVRNQSIPDWDHPFDKTEWIYYSETPTGLQEIAQIKSVKDALAFFPYLNGEHTEEQVRDKLQGNEEGNALLQSLMDKGVIESKEQARWDYDQIPDFFFLGHSGLMVRSGEDLLAIDPVIVPSTRSLSRSNLPIDAIVSHANAILISHAHWDHFHYQTLVRLPRDTKIIVPKQTYPTTYANPPMAPYLRDLGFTNVEERSPWDVIELGEITLTLADFLGEPFGLDSQFDGLTYHIKFGDNTLYGSVDACNNEDLDMEETINKVTELTPIDYYLFCSSNQHHNPAYNAANLRHFSNELIKRPELIKYHPSHVEPTSWAKRLKPKVLIPYAEFLFQGESEPHISMQSLLGQDLVNLGGIPQTHSDWGSSLKEMAAELKLPMQFLHPMQGLIR